VPDSRPQGALPNSPIDDCYNGKGCGGGTGGGGPAAGRPTVIDRIRDITCRVAGIGCRAVADRVLQDDGSLRISKTAGAKWANQRSFITQEDVLSAIRNGQRLADPQAVPGAYLYRAPAGYTLETGRVSSGYLDVIVNERTNTVIHLIYKSGALPR
jgi:hypothetical protein